MRECSRSIVQLLTLKGANTLPFFILYSVVFYGRVSVAVCVLALRALFFVVETTLGRIDLSDCSNRYQTADSIDQENLLVLVSVATV